MSEDRAFWDGVIRAAGAEPREARLIRGISGLEHPVAGVGVDEDGRRLVVISTAPEARSAAMAQADIQATMQNVQVVVARPVVVDMAAFAKELGAALGRPEIGSEDFARIPTTRDGLTPEEINQQMQERMRPYLETFHPVIQGVISSIGLPAIGVLGGIMQAMEQLRQVKLTSTAVAVEGGEERSDFKLEFAELAEDDPLAPDLRLGICPLPLFRFEESELELIASAPSQDEVRELLEKHGVTTYFFPALVPHVRRGCPPRQLCSSSVCARSIRKRSPMRRRRAISALSHLVVSRRGGLAVGAPVDCTFCAGTTIE